MSAPCQANVGSLLCGLNVSTISASGKYCSRHLFKELDDSPDKKIDLNVDEIEKREKEEDSEYVSDNEENLKVYIEKSKYYDPVKGLYHYVIKVDNVRFAVNIIDGSIEVYGVEEISNKNNKRFSSVRELNENEKNILDDNIVYF